MWWAVTVGLSQTEATRSQQESLVNTSNCSTVIECEETLSDVDLQLGKAAPKVELRGKMSYISFSYRTAWHLLFVRCGYL